MPRIPHCSLTPHKFTTCSLYWFGLAWSEFEFLTNRFVTIMAHSASMVIKKWTISSIEHWLGNQLRPKMQNTLWERDLCIYCQLINRKIAICSWRGHECLPCGNETFLFSRARTTVKIRHSSSMKTYSMSVCLPFVGEQTNVANKSAFRVSFNGQTKKRIPFSKWQRRKSSAEEVRASCQQSLETTWKLFLSPFQSVTIYRMWIRKLLAFYCFFVFCLLSLSLALYRSLSPLPVLFFAVGKMSCFNALFEM